MKHRKKRSSVDYILVLVILNMIVLLFREKLVKEISDIICFLR